MLFSLWGMSRPPLRMLLAKVSLFAASLSSLAVFSSVASIRPLNTIIVLSTAASLTIIWAAATAVLLRPLDISFGLIFSEQAHNPPKTEPEKTKWAWKEAAYIGAILRPGGMLFLFLLICVAMWLVKRSSPPHVPAPLTISLIIGPLLVPFVFLTGWCLSLTPKMRLILVKSPLQLNQRYGAIALSIFLTAVAGSRIFERPVPNAVLLLSSLIFLMLIVSIFRLSVAAGPDQDSSADRATPFPKEAHSGVSTVLFVTLLTLAISIYSTLMVLTL